MKINCIEELLNLLMTAYSIIMIEHYMILLLILKARSDEGVKDQLLNSIREHLDKERRILKVSRLGECLSSDIEALINDFVKNVDYGLSIVDDPEFLSNYINNFRETLTTVAKYVLNHEELASGLISKLQNIVLNEVASFLRESPRLDEL
ncbi:MAG: hypothetical protein L7H10_00050 [Vulcanisaeta sp.]|nr:hypothetical protein [Vulcanisaeta sp.]